MPTHPLQGGAAANLSHAGQEGERSRDSAEGDRATRAGLPASSATGPIGVTLVTETPGSTAAMIHGFSFVFCFALSYQGIVPFKKKNPNFILAELPSGEKREFSRPRPADPGDQGYRGIEEGQGHQSLPFTCMPGAPAWASSPALLRFGNTEAVKREMKEIHCMAFGDP